MLDKPNDSSGTRSKNTVISQVEKNVSETVFHRLLARNYLKLSGLTSLLKRKTHTSSESIRYNLQGHYKHTPIYRQRYTWFSNILPKHSKMSLNHHIHQLTTEGNRWFLRPLLKYCAWRNVGQITFYVPTAFILFSDAKAAAKSVWLTG